MTIRIEPKKLKGTVRPPTSKSQAHRYLLCAALAEEESVIEEIELSEDLEATLRCIEILGAAWTAKDSKLTVQGLGGKKCREKELQFDCGESGSTLRFIIPLSLALAGGGRFTGRGRLMERPQGPYEKLFKEKGIKWERENGALKVTGCLEPGEYRLAGDVSSQFFTGLLLALPLLDKPSVIVPTTRLESAGYVDMTLDAMARFGVEVPTTRSIPPHYMTPGGSRYKPRRMVVEGDWSQAAFWIAANSAGCAVELEGMDENSLQGDRVVMEFYERMSHPGNVEIDVSGCPDLAPPLAAAAAVREGTVRLTGTARLRIKESDRAQGIREVLTALGAAVDEAPDSLTIKGKHELTGGCEIDCRNDHRIAMMTAIAAVRCREPVTLKGAECVRKSYPRFWEDYRKLGGYAVEYDWK